MSTPTLTPARRRASSPREEIRAHLALLAGQPGPGELLELRFRFQTGGMARRFYPAHQPAGMVEAIHRLGSRCDVYVGCAPRTRRSGGRDAVERAWVLWAECDSLAARAAVKRFTPAPTLVIASGSPHGRHAYWALTDPANADTLEHGNRRLAHALGADPVCVDAARILRPLSVARLVRGRLVPAPSFADASVAEARRARRGRAAPSVRFARRALGARRLSGAR